MPSAGKRELRFGYGFFGTDRDDLATAVHSAEAFGFDTFLMPDHLGDQLSPIPTLAVVAELSDTLRIAPWVLCNAFHIPEVLGRELATIEVLSRGRLDVGIGSGWHRDEFDRAGIAFNPGGQRFRELQHSVEVISALLAGGLVTLDNDHHHLDGHLGFPSPVQRPHPPLMLGGGGRKMLEWAATTGDIVSIIPKAGPDGGVLGSELTIESVERKIGWIRAAAGDRFEQITINLVLVDMTVTTDRRAAAQAVSRALRAGQLPIFVGEADLDENDVLNSPYFALGTIPEIAEHISTVCERTGATYYGTFPHVANTFGPVIEHIRQT